MPWLAGVWGRMRNETVGPVADNYRATWRDAEVRLVWMSNAPFLDYKSPKSTKRFPLSPRSDGPLQPSLDGSVIALSELEEVPTHHMILRRWRAFDFETGKLIDLEGQHMVPAAPFVATADTLIMNQVNVEVLDKATYVITAYDRATGKRRWQEVLKEPSPPSRPPVLDRRDPRLPAPP